MKITLKAHIPEHREIAKMFGILVDDDNECFVEWIDGLEYRAKINSITIDTSKSEMDLRLAIGTDIEFRLPHYTPNRILRTANFSEGVNVFNFNQFFGIDADKIKLCPDYLRLVGVEVED